jgi:hypothetical protein
MTNAEYFGGYLGVLALFSLFTGNVAALYFGYTEIESLLNHFKTSSPSITNAVNRHRSLRNRLQLVGSACVILTFSNFYIKHGILSRQDLENFPHSLRRKLVVLQWSVNTSFVVVALLTIALKTGILK